MQEIAEQFIREIKDTSWLEFIAVVTGIASVVFSRKENILVFPIGIISTVIFIYLYITHGLYADASVNFYYTVMSIIGWFMWARKKDNNTKLIITGSNKKDWQQAIIFFIVCWIILFTVLKKFTDSTVPQADSFTSAAALTGMWLMNKKKLENWVWWLITDIVSIPLNFYKHLAFTSFQYLIFLVLATMGYITWKEKIKNQKPVIK
ncbi:MAG TPA: nicotinamide riboside transporter PnuC [Chitinophagaceae bacterium]|nr:nicotinamide riboside transporter PnuC [Chitinophagaceae bacterium]